jgi:hypothetical protein
MTSYIITVAGESAEELRRKQELDMLLLAAKLSTGKPSKLVDRLVGNYIRGRSVSGRGRSNTVRRRTRSKAPARRKSKKQKKQKKQKKRSRRA